MANPFALRAPGAAVGGTANASAPHRGQGAFGLVPGSISTPDSIWTQTSSAVPGFGGLTQGASDIVGSEQSGALSPQTVNALRTASAQFGIQSGMPGSGLADNQLLGNIAGFSENRQRQGLQDYMSLISNAGRMQTDPSLAASIADRNATLAAAPDPQAAAERQLAEWIQKFKMGQQAAMGGPAGGTGTSPWARGGTQSAGLSPSASMGRGWSYPGAENAFGYAGGSGPGGSLYGSSHDYTSGFGGVGGSLYGNNYSPSPWLYGGGGGTYSPDAGINPYDWSNSENYAGDTGGGGEDWSDPYAFLGDE